MHLSHIDLRLDYEVDAPAHLRLNIEATRTGAQTVLSEMLSIEPPPVRRQTGCEPESGNRFVRFDAQPGPLTIAYRATVRRPAVHVPAT